jgi:hypothetical protein
MMTVLPMSDREMPWLRVLTGCNWKSFAPCCLATAMT